MVTAIGISEIKKSIEKMSNGTQIAYLGINGTDVTEDANEELGVPYGAFVRDTDMGSPSMRAGIQRGDVLVAFGETNIKNYNDYIAGKIYPRGTDAFIIMRVREVFMNMASIIGIFENIEDTAVDNELVDKLMNIIVSIRQCARNEKNWTIADKIRDELKTAGIVLEDTPQGVKWKRG